MPMMRIFFRSFINNILKYLAFIFACSLSLTYMFIFISLNNAFRQTYFDQYDQIRGVLSVLLPYIMVICFLYISFSYYKLLKHKNKEMEILKILGISERDVHRVRFLDTFLVLSLSLVMGLGLGSIAVLVIQKVFAMLILESIPLGIDVNAYFSTCVAFFFIYLAVLLMNRTHVAHKSETPQKIDRLKNASFKNKNRLLWLGLGLLLLCFGIINGYFFSGAYFSDIAAYRFKAKIIPYITVFSYLVGIYLVVSQLGYAILHLCMNKKRFYYRRMLFLAQLDEMFLNYKKLFTILSILSSFVVLILGVTYVYFFGMAENARLENPYDIVYVDAGDDEKLPESKLQEILSKSSDSVSKTQTFEFIYQYYLFKKDFRYDVVMDSILSISETCYQKLTGDQLFVKAGHMVAVKQNYDPSKKRFSNGDVMQVFCAGKSQNIKVQKQLEKILLNKAYFEVPYMMVFNDTDYQRMRQSLLEGQKQMATNFVGRLHTVQLKDWRDSQELMDRINAQIQKSMGKRSYKDYKEVLFAGTKKNFFVGSLLEAYESRKEKDPFMALMIGLIGVFILLYMSSSLVIKELSEIDDKCDKYRKLSDMGMKPKEIRRGIGHDLKLAFFIPFLWGVLVLAFFVFGSCIFTVSFDIVRINLKMFLYTILSIFLFLYIHYLVVKLKAYQRVKNHIGIVTKKEKKQEIQPTIDESY